MFVSVYKYGNRNDLCCLLLLQQSIFCRNFQRWAAFWAVIFALFVGSIFYPLYYFLGVEKIEITAIISLVISVAIIVGISLLINIWLHGDVSDTTYYISLIVILIITCLSFVCSYLLSAFLYKKKEF